MFHFIATTNPADIIDPERTLGIEVTDRTTLEVLSRTGRTTFNIDGQHGTGAGSWDGIAIAQWLDLPHASRADCAAIAIATHMYSPVDGTTFLTTRPDLDSIGAMAVLVIRGAGLWPAMGSAAENALRDRVRAIAEADAFTPSADWAPSPLPTEENQWPRAGSVDSTDGLAHLGMICSPRRGDVALPLAERVAIVACWLLLGEGGDLPMNQSDESGPVVSEIYGACGVDAWTDIETSPMSRLIDARARVMGSRKALAREAHRDGAIEVRGSDPFYDFVTYGIPSGPVAIVRVAHAGAMGLGYCVAPVVIAFDQANPGKVTIATYAAKYLDVQALKARLNALEPGWGGGTTIIGSPQGVGTKLSDETIVAEARACRS